MPYEKVGKNEPVCIADEVPFEIPESWEWVRLGELFQHNTGKALNSSNRSGELLTYITTSNLYWNRFKIDNLREMYFSEAEIQKCTATKGDLLVCEGGDIGRAAIWSYDTDIRIQNHIHRLRSYSEVCVEYYYYIFFLYKHAGWIGGKGIGIQGLSSNALHSLLFPLPPLQEQHRIVAKIKEIAPFLDKYEQTEQNLNDLNVRFPEMLKKSILQEAVQGKLVPQNPLDESASALLERIRAEKEQLIQEGKIKRDKHESVIYRRDNSHYEKHGSEEVCIDKELPFEIPDNWEWVKLSDLAQFIGGYAYKSETFIEKSEYQVLRLGNVKNDEIRYSAKPVFISKELAEKTADFRSKPNDILLTMTGTRLKRDYFYTVAVSNKDTNCFINQRVGCLREYYPNIYKWLIWVLKSEGILSQVFKYETGTANQGNLGAENIMKTFIPLPPLNEQNKICNMIECLLKKTSAL